MLSNKTVKIAWKDCDWTTFRFFDFLKDRYFETKIKYWLKASLSSFAHILHFSLYYFNGVSSHPLPFHTKVMTSLHDKDITCCCGGKCNKRHIIQYWNIRDTESISRLENLIGSRACLKIYHVTSLLFTNSRCDSLKR